MTDKTLREDWEAFKDFMERRLDTMDWTVAEMIKLATRLEEVTKERDEAHRKLAKAAPLLHGVDLSETHRG